ncbi:hypothetical protein [Brevibacillus sp. AF8]|uniref:hypothetical protein n=1 Tax=Brevibacillus sp. AF8 TaxID=2825881 RepID=UPI001E49E696|nr:hypothetical protein [Brevibacillus sp. AF8]MCE0450047.1 hypothetical protein [Brevibacillus sp. AF8]
MYRNEMTDADHIELLDALDENQGPVILSGYDNDLYNIRLKHWRREEKKVLAEMGRIRTEVIWINPVAVIKWGCRPSSRCPAYSGWILNAHYIKKPILSKDGQG